MKIILKQDLDNLGKVGEIVDVKPGYARNYLIPKGFAMRATDSALRMVEEEQKRMERQHEKEKEQAQVWADELSKVSVTATVQVGEEDKVFGSVTNQDIATLLKDAGHEVDRKKIILDEPIKALGVYDVPVKLHPQVEATIKVWVVRE
ncbi:50S ribosomal protein L9 [candidate division KSB1 bacterium]|nr:50S ribosomal protein L9 [candidate division KSB1 bacterium]